jgi:hypothetical protein
MYERSPTQGSLSRVTPACVRFIFQLDHLQEGLDALVHSLSTDGTVLE